MSDKDKVGQSTNRSGMNADKDVLAGTDGSTNPNPKKRRNRSRRRSNKSNAGVPANTVREAHGAATANGADRQHGENGASHRNEGRAVPDGMPKGKSEDQIAKSGRGKRARRRRGKGNNRSNPSPPSDGINANGADRSDSSSRENFNRRKVPNDQNAAVENRDRAKRQRNGQRKGERNAHNNEHAKNQSEQIKGKAQGRPGQKQFKSERKADAYAALDLGTNNCRLLVAVPQQPGRFRVVDAFSRIVRLGEGLASSGKLSDDAMNRAVVALKACSDKLKSRNVRGVRLIATEACRRAENGDAFLRRVEEEADLKLEIIDRETEAKLAVAGCSSLIDRKAKGVVLFDIGGGSSELALLDLSKRKRHDFGPAMVSWTSLPLGVVTLSEKHGGGKLVTRQVFDNMVEEVCELLEEFQGRDALKDAMEQGEVHLLGTSGTVTTLAGIHLKLPRYDRREVDGTWMTGKSVEEMINTLVDMSFEERVENPCIGQDRADLVLAGCAILVAIQKFWPCPRLRVADRGLREGLLTQMMNADNAWQRRSKYFRSRGR